METGLIIKQNNKLYLQYKKDLFDGIFYYPDYYVIDFKSDIDVKEGDKVFDFMDKDVAKIINKI